jgi:hypothetical protein
MKNTTAKTNLLEHLHTDPLGLLENYAGDEAADDLISEATNVKARKEKIHRVMLKLYNSLDEKPSEGIAKLVLSYLQGELDTT